MHEEDQVLSVGGSAIGHLGPLTTWRHTILDSLTPSADRTAVIVEGYEDEAGTTGAWQVSASAICAYPRPNQQRISATTAAGPADKTRSVECPARLDRLVPHHESGLTGGDIDARTDQNGATVAWTASVYLICAG
jgi:hypothetical protein